MKILIVKTSSLGDIIHAFPSLAYLRKRFPDATIDWMVEKPNASLVQAHPAINHVIPVDTKKWRKHPISSWREIKEFSRDMPRYDIAFDLQGNTKSGLLLSRVQARSKVGFGWGTAPERLNGFFTNMKCNPPDLPIRQENLFLVQSFFSDQEIFHEEPIALKITPEESLLLPQYTKAKILVCPGSAWPNKQVPSETLIQFLQKLSSPFAFTWGNEKEKEEVEKIASHFSNSIILPKLSLPLLQNVMREMELVIAMDSLPLHLAGTAGVPTFGIFGPSSSAKYNPSGRLHLVHQGSCPYGRTFTRRCPILRSCPTGLCTRNITADELFDSLRLTAILKK